LLCDRDCGPNILCTSAASSASSLWALPPAALCRLSSATARRAANHSGGPSAAEAEPRSDAAEWEGEHWTVPLGAALVAAKLGLEVRAEGGITGAQSVKLNNLKPYTKPE
jgi:hypothetical protein